MSRFSRRDFLSLTARHCAGSRTATPEDRTQVRPRDQGWRRFDPSQSLRGKRDIGIRWRDRGVENGSRRPCRKTIEPSGKLMTPGLIDLHSHVYPYGSAIASPRRTGAFSRTRPRGVAATPRQQSRALPYIVAHPARFTPSSYRTTACLVPVASLQYDNAQSRPVPWRSPKIRTSVGSRCGMSENVIYKTG